MALARVQSHLGIHTIQVPGAVTIGAAPTAGNLLIAFIGVNETGWTVGSGWTQFDAVSFSEYNTSYIIICLYRYVVGGDTATLPAFMSAGLTYWTHDVYEVSGVTGIWTTDFLRGVKLQDIISNRALPTITMPVDGGLALVSSASYNGTSNPTITGSWTMDDSANNAVNYGSASGSHRLMDRGDAIDGTLSQGTSSPLAAYLLMLGPAQPDFLYVRRGYSAKTNVAATDSPGAFTLPFTPEVGELLVCYIYWRDGSAASPTLSSDWTEFASISGAGGKMVIGAYRYVVGGDTNVTPALTTAGANWWAIDLVEIANASGVFADDHVSDKKGWQISGTSLTTIADYTGADDQFALLAYANYNGNNYALATGFDGYDKTDWNTAYYGSWFLAEKDAAAAGTMIQGTITAVQNFFAQAYIQSIFGAGGGGVGAAVRPPFLWVD